MLERDGWLAGLVIWLVLLMLYVLLVLLVLLVLPGAVPLFAPLTTVDKILPFLELALSLALALADKLPLVPSMALTFSAPTTER